jgi:hypothetical protein
VVHVAWADVEAYAAWVEDYQDAAHTFLHESRHPTLGRSFHQCGYRPMIELLGYLEANGFTSWIASGGDRDLRVDPAWGTVSPTHPRRVDGGPAATVPA